MNYGLEIKKHPNVDKSILFQYKDAPEEIVVNKNDPDLHEIHIKLPQQPELNEIAGFGLPPEQQKWKKPELPVKLERLVKKHSTVDEIWAVLQNNQTYYKDEITFIKQQWYYFLNGYWFFNNGVPTYLDGWHWFYIAWWKIDIGSPKYRYRDYLFFNFARFCYTDTTAYFPFRIKFKEEYTYFSYEENAYKFCEQKSISEKTIEKGEYIVDTKKRTCYGFNYPKFRREGATFKSGCINYCIAITHRGKSTGIQGNRRETGKQTYITSVVRPWRKLPFFFKPTTTSNSNPQSALVFDTETEKSGNIVIQKEGLQVIMDYEMSEANGYDGRNLAFHHHDEVGKFPSDVDMVQVSGVVKECLSVGRNITGFGIKTSTVGEMKSGGGARFKHYCDMSMWNKRNENGQTQSGFYDLFISSDICLDGFIDEFGNPVIETPEIPVVGENGDLIKQGAREYLLNTREAFIKDARFDDWVEFVQKFPLTFRECFTVNPEGTQINKYVLIKRQQEIQFHNPELRRGNLYRIGGPNTDTNVEFLPDPQGRFAITMLPPAHMKNARTFNKEMNWWEPEVKHCGAGADPFKQKTTKDGTGSKGAGAVYYPHEFVIDPFDNPEKFRVSEQFICTYLNRTYDKDEYAEDMLMMVQFYSSMMFPEINIDLIWDYFERRGYGGYLIYAFDRKTNRFKNTPGATAANNSIKQDIFTEYMTWSNRHAFKESQIDLIDQVVSIGGLDEMTKFDLFAAGGYALLAIKYMKYLIDDYKEKENKEKLDIRSYFQTFRKN